MDVGVVDKSVIDHRASGDQETVVGTKKDDLGFLKRSGAVFGRRDEYIKLFIDAHANMLDRRAQGLPKRLPRRPYVDAILLEGNSDVLEV